MTSTLSRTIACAAIATLFQRHRWIGWTAWAIFVLTALARTHPRRFGSTFSAYLDAARRLWTGQQVYDPTTLGDFLYFPITLLVYTPFTLIERVPAAAIALALGAAFFTWACTRLALSLLSADWRSTDALAFRRGPAGQYSSGVVQLQRRAGAGADDRGDDGSLRRHHRLARGRAGAEQA